MSIKEKLNDYFSLNDSDNDNQEALSEKKSVKEMNKSTNAVAPQRSENNEMRKSSHQNIVAINHQQALKKPKIKVMEPRLYSDVQSIADILLNNQSVILNFRRMEKGQATKMIDFLMGTTYAIKGDIQRLGEEIFICTPQSFEVDGAELQALKNNEY
ncbi:cell division protein SepF [Alkalibacterium olivapovliticus]|uniref:Cell division protein SepF n=1 Tax=Alkalibacterium olivapovliticus TaxID=99907 RepID=A0A2T0WB77_9LACT|nr:cell division protein SepF [Alkalibacterium olivapovliticus]PRY83952.1 cell division inhibitor SepF [Alkalibacterium olivapovliticus]